MTYPTNNRVKFTPTPEHIERMKRIINIINRLKRKHIKQFFDSTGYVREDRVYKFHVGDRKGGPKE